MDTRFEVAHGTILGRNHRRAQKNNQDSYCISSSPALLVAVVTDGCSSGLRSDVGAHIGSRIVCNALVRHASDDPDWERIRNEVVVDLDMVAFLLGGERTNVVLNHLLFTVVGALITERRGFLFSIGDGVAAVNRELIPIGPFPENMPPYVAYELLEPGTHTLDPSLLKFRIHRIVPAEAIESIIIGTDGVMDLVAAAEKNIPGSAEPVGSVHQFVNDDGYFKNPDKVRRRLTLINRDCGPDRERNRPQMEPGLLPDDTTLIAIRRKLIGA